MKRKIICLVIAVFFIISNNAYAQTAADIISRYIEAIGGKDRIENLKSLYVESTGDISGIEFVIRETILNGEAYKHEMDFIQASIINSYSNKGGWKINPLSGIASATDLSDEEIQAGRLKMVIGAPFINYNDLGYTANLEGEEDVNGNVVWEIKLTDKNNVDAYYYFDKSSGLLIKSVAYEESMGQLVQSISMFSEYRNVENILIPYQRVSTSKDGMFNISSKVKSVEINKSLSGDYFDKPKGKAVISQEEASKLKTYKPLYDDVIPTCSQEDLYNIDLPNTTITSVRVEPENNLCMVTAHITHPPHKDDVVVNVALPLTGWNGRFAGIGGGGFTGGTEYSLYLPVASGFAAGSTNGGHQGGSGSFAYDRDNNRLDWQSIRNFSYQAIHDMTVVGKALVTKFYGKPAKYSYFDGGSNGGRQAMESVQRFPEDYDGVFARCPALYWNHFLLDFLWPAAVMNDVNNCVSKEKLRAVTEAVIKACDGNDGVIDGVIDDPLNCTWDPKEFIGNMVGGEVFTEADANVVRKIWDGPRGNNNRFLWYGATRGTDLTIFAHTSGNPLQPNPNIIGVEWVRYFLVSDPEWDGKTITVEEFERLFNQSVDQYASTFQTDNTDLTVFRDKEKKVILTHGLADNMIPPQGTLEYYKQLQKDMGGPEATAEFARLFLFPSLDHGFNGPGPKPVDVLSALIEWVEEGKAPEYLEAELKDENGEVIRRTSVFSYRK